jgi:hypothetical protein
LSPSDEAENLFIDSFEDELMHWINVILVDDEKKSFKSFKFQIRIIGATSGLQIHQRKMRL